MHDGPLFRRLTLPALLVSLALMLSAVERLFSLDLLLPVPGLRLGLPNIVTLFALWALPAKTALLILVLRCVLASLFGGGASALIFSLSGGLLAFVVMWALFPLEGKRLSAAGISVAGAAAHNVGQTAGGARRHGHRRRIRVSPLLAAGLGADRPCHGCGISGHEAGSAAHPLDAGPATGKASSIGRLARGKTKKAGACRISARAGLFCCRLRKGPLCEGVCLQIWGFCVREGLPAPPAGRVFQNAAGKAPSCRISSLCAGNAAPCGRFAGAVRGKGGTFGGTAAGRAGRRGGQTLRMAALMPAT